MKFDVLCALLFNSEMSSCVFFLEESKDCTYFQSLSKVFMALIVTK